MTHTMAVRPLRRLACLALLAASWLAPASAADWPEKPVRLVVPFAAGGATDLLGRALAAELGRVWKQTVIVDNRSGAGGSLGAEIVAKAPADGHTLLLASASMFTVNPYLYPKLAYSGESFEMISKVASGPMVVTVNNAVPARDLKELIAWGKAHPGQLHFASAGNGSQAHMAGEAFADASELDLVHVPYKGEGPGYADLMAGVVQMVVGNLSAAYPLLKGGRLRALAVTGTERSALLPQLPTAAESGLAGLEFVGWFGLAAPAGTPQGLVQKIHADLRLAAEQEAMKRYLADQGMSAAPSGPLAMKRDIASEALRWKALVAKRNIKAQ